eukprot:GHVH01004441.1.p1 GENE.GHVH01004441.1~~GHVH01004441.1.p1  ORF type:complete len:525 (+),score=80.47 GHVH01004441.1:27-1601(+)
MHRVKQTPHSVLASLCNHVLSGQGEVWNDDLFSPNEVDRWVAAQVHFGASSSITNPSSKSLSTIANSLDSDSLAFGRLTAWLKEADAFLTLRCGPQARHWNKVLHAASLLVEKKTATLQSPGVMALASTDVPMSSSIALVCDVDGGTDGDMDGADPPSMSEQLSPGESSTTSDAATNDVAPAPSLKQNSPPLKHNMRTSIYATPACGLVDSTYRFYSQNEIVDSALLGLIGKTSRLTVWSPESRMLVFKSPSKLPPLLVEQVDLLLRWGVDFANASAYLPSHSVAGRKSDGLKVVRTGGGMVRRVIGCRNPSAVESETPKLNAEQYSILSERNKLCQDLVLRPEDELFIGPLAGDGGLIIGSDILPLQRDMQLIDMSPSSQYCSVPTILGQGSTYQIIQQYCRTVVSEWSDFIGSLQAQSARPSPDVKLTLTSIYLALIEMSDQLHDVVRVLMACQGLSGDAMLTALHSILISDNPIVPRDDDAFLNISIHEGLLSNRLLDLVWWHSLPNLLQLCSIIDALAYF